MSAISNEAEFICRQIEIIVFEQLHKQQISAMSTGGGMIITSVVELPEIDLRN